MSRTNEKSGKQRNCYLGETTIQRGLILAGELANGSFSALIDDLVNEKYYETNFDVNKKIDEIQLKKSDLKNKYDDELNKLNQQEERLKNISPEQKSNINAFNDMKENYINIMFSKMVNGYTDDKLNDWAVVQAKTLNKLIKFDDKQIFPPEILAEARKRYNDYIERKEKRKKGDKNEFVQKLEK